MLTYNQKQLVYWIIERNNIRLKKEAGEQPPWTDNKVMQETYFCNVNREDDRVTRWIRNNWTYDIAPDYYTFAMVVARIFNLPSTLQAVQQPIDVHWWIENAEEVLREKQEHKQPIWNGAYIVSTNGRKIDKLTHCIEIFKQFEDNPDPVAGVGRLEDAHKKLMGLYGLASFLAAQVVADLKNSKGHPLQKAPDWWRFSAYGPGSLRGLSWFWEREIRPNTYQQAIKEAYELIELELPDDIINILCMQNFQNCFCEYDKFMRVSTGTGKSKRHYKKGK